MVRGQRKNVASVGRRSRIAAPEMGRRSAVWRRLTRGVVLVTLVLATVGTGTAAAGGADICPEPNDRLQAACNLGTASDALGFISRPDDVDSYRLVTHDFGARVSLSLPDRPHPYRLALVGYDGAVLHSTDAGTIDTVLPLPGTYFALVDSATGESDDSAPYRIALGVGYPAGTDPTVLYSEEYSHRSRTAAEGALRASTAYTGPATYGYGDGNFYVQLVTPGTTEKPWFMGFTVEPTTGVPRSAMDDFTLSIDTEMLAPVDAGYTVAFRWIDDDNFVRVLVSLQDRQATLGKIVNGELVTLTDWTPVPALRSIGVNRTIVRYVGPEIRVSINGQEFAHVHDDTFRQGLIGFGAATWGEPTTIYFDNILVTTPTHQ
jgi:hypothetical protein